MAKQTVRAIIEIPRDALAGSDNFSDTIVDVLIEGFDTPDVQVLDLVEQDEPAWHRSERF